MMRRGKWRVWSVLLWTAVASAPAMGSEQPAPPVDPSSNKSLPAPFQLTADEEKNVGRVLERWEQWNSGVKTFTCRFKRWTYDVVFGPANQPKFIDSGVITYAAPNRVMYGVGMTEKDGKEVPIEDVRAEHWAFDGKSIFELKWTTKQLIEHKLPPEIQQKFQRSPSLDGPLAFGSLAAPLVYSIFSLFGTPPLPPPYPFGAKAEELKQRYYLRIITPPGVLDQIWLEAYPRSKGISCLLARMQLIFAARDMSPFALRIMQPDQKSYTVYQFLNIAVNPRLQDCFGDPFHPVARRGWQTIVDGQPQAGGAPNRRR